ncbi:MAG: PD-(D/E)XK nuclease family protein [Myxococcales bacterium]
MHASRSELIVVAGLVLALALLWLGARANASWQRLTQRRAGRRYNERGQAGERRAEQLLRAAGYRVRARRITRSYALEVDGQREQVQLIADLVVERNGQAWVAEVKTGDQAPRLGHSDTRRQMLEYQLAFAVPGVLLVDAEAGEIREVCFPLLTTNGSNRGRWRLAPLVFGLAALVLLAAITLTHGAFDTFLRE